MFLLKSFWVHRVHKVHHVFVDVAMQCPSCQELSKLSSKAKIFTTKW